MIRSQLSSTINPNPRYELAKSVMSLSHYSLLAETVALEYGDCLASLGKLVKPECPQVRRYGQKMSLPIAKIIKVRIKVMPVAIMTCNARSLGGLPVMAS